MPRVAVEDNSRMSLRIRAEEKALLMRAVALEHTDLTDFVLRHALDAAKAVIQDGESACAERQAAGCGSGVAEAEIVVTAWHLSPGTKSRFPKSMTGKRSTAAKKR